MIQRNIDIKPAALAAFEKESKQLLLCLEEDNLLIALADKQSGEWNALENFVLAKADWHNMPETLQHIKQQSSLVSLNVPDTQLYYRTPAAMPIPASVRESITLFMQTGFGLQAPDEILTDEVNGEMSVSIVIPEAQIRAFRYMCPQVTWNSTLALLIKQAQQVQGKTVLPQLFLTLGASLAEMVFMKNDQLLTARCFQYYTAENLVYHLVNTCNQFRISQAEVFIKAQGLIDEEGEMYALLHQYFLHVEFMKTGMQNQQAAFDKIPAHYFSHLAGNEQWHTVDSQQSTVS